MKVFMPTFRDIEQTFRHALLMALVYLLPVAQSLSPVEDPDIWWHLRAGQWIVQHGAVPYIDYFSSYGYGKPWVAYSWLFEVIVYKLVDWFGLLGLIFFNVLLAIALTAAIHLLVRHARLNLVLEVVLTATTLVCLKPLMNPRAWLFSIFFFTLQLLIILNFRKSQNERRLWLLPALFALWANIHIQFIYGLAVFALFVFEPTLQRWLALCGAQTKPTDVKLSSSTAFRLLAGCMLATLINPYHVRVYKPVFEVMRDTKAFDMISELQALTFRHLDNWFVLILLVSVVFCLGWRREQRLFPLGLMIMGGFLSFRARRDVWVGALASVFVIVDWPAGYRASVRLSRGSIVFAGLFAALGIVYFADSRSISNNGLSNHLAKKYPVDAVRFVATEQLPGSIFNHYDWGGFLMWNLPKFLVTLDGRSNLHGEDRVERHIDIWLGRPGWNQDPELAQARLVIGPASLPLATLLRSDPRFQLCYEDKIAAVFVTAQHASSGRCPNRLSKQT